jgi:serine/threonine protein kinase
MVWLARAASSPGTCVLKLLRPGFVERPEGQEAFTRLQTSVQIHGRLHHPNLVEIYEPVADPARRLFGVSMGYVEGQTLADTQIPASVIQGQDLRGLATILSWFEELGAALAWLHTQRIVHGNLKPTNVMLSQHQGRSVVKVLDLCWAAIGIAAPPPSAPWSVSPEQLRGQPPTKESDQWALASMLTRMLSGGHSTLRLGVMPQVLVMALSRALDESPHQRYGHMAELVSAIRSIRMELEQRARESRNAPVDPREFADEPETVRKELRRTSLEVTARDSRNPFVPGSRALSKEISDEHSAPALSLEINSGEHSAPALRHDVGDPFQGPLVPDDFSRVRKDPRRNEPSFGLDSVLEQEGTEPSTGIGGRSASRLTAIGVLFFLIAGGIIAATIWLVGRDSPPDDLRTARASAQPADVVPPPPQQPAPPADPNVPPEAAQDPSAPNAEVRPPQDPSQEAKVGSPQDAKLGSPQDPAVRPPSNPNVPPPDDPARRQPSSSEVRSPKDSGVRPPADPKKQKAKPLDNLDAKADEALAKLLGEPAPEPKKQTDREVSVACDEGDGQACVELGDRLAKRKVTDRAVKAFERACTFSVADGCHRASVLLTDEARSAHLQEKACQLGRKLSCKTEEPIAKTSTTAT